MSAVETKKIIDAIRKFLTEVSKLSDGQLEQFINGDLAFKFETTKATLDYEKFKCELYNCTDRVQGVAYLNKTKMTGPQLKEFAKHLKCSLFGATKKADIITQIVNGTVGARSDTAAVHRT